MSTTVSDAPSAPRRDAASASPEAARPGFRATLRQLGSAQKPGKRGPAYTVHVNRRLARPLAAAAYVVGLSPNAVTCISAGFTAGAIALLALAAPTWGIGFAVAGLLLVGFALDSADGQVARLRGGGSPAGEWLDHTLDSVKIPALHLAVLIAFYRWGEMHEGWLLVPLGFAIVASAVFFTLTFTEQLVHRHANGQATRGPGRRQLLRSLLMLPTDYGVVCWSFVLLGAPHLFLGVYGAMLAAGVLHLAWLLTRSFADVRAAERQGR